MDSKRKFWLGAAGFLALMVVLGNFTALGEAGGTRGSAGPNDFACDTFRGNLPDLRQGVLTDEEGRDVLVRVRRDASGVVEDAATDAVTAWTQDAPDSVKAQALGELDLACRGAGL